MVSGLSSEHVIRFEGARDPNIFYAEVPIMLSGLKGAHRDHSGSGKGPGGAPEVSRRRLGA